MSSLTAFNAIEVDSTLIIFGCGHMFMMNNEETPTLDDKLQKRMRCPLCIKQGCLSCPGVFAGWLTTCAFCENFGFFQDWIDEAVGQDIRKMVFRHGIIMVPRVGKESTLIPDWPTELSIGKGYVGRWEVELLCDSDVSEQTMKLHLSAIQRLNNEGQVSHKQFKDDHTIELRVENSGVTPQEKRMVQFIRLL
ncbi:hypothetical protein F4780DRAFT_786683 [Xylariomycetidae sp. FL0641]|nr:hypothetical protein F4780DRAFT_786683 [Xylariomycetidae sp. FL0641]